MRIVSNRPIPKLAIVAFSRDVRVSQPLFRALELPLFADVTAAATLLFVQRCEMPPVCLKGFSPAAPACGAEATRCASAPPYAETCNAVKEWARGQLCGALGTR